MDCFILYAQLIMGKREISSMTEVCVCDENKEDLYKFAKIILETAEEDGIEVQISCFESAENLISEINEFKKNIDIIYINPNMEKGKLLAHKMAEKPYDTMIIFLADSYKDLYYAFEARAVQFFLKSQIKLDEFKVTFRNAYNNLAENKGDLFVCEFAGIRTSLPLKDIEYFEIKNRVIQISYRNKDNDIKFYGSMESLQKYLEKKLFLRIHRSYLINMLYIDKLSARKVILKTGDELPIGKLYAESSKKAFEKYIEKNHIFYRF